MKKIAILLLVGSSLIACNQLKENIKSTAIRDSNRIQFTYVKGNISIVKIDGCEYVIWDGYQKGGIIHKSNCPNPDNYHK